MAVKIWVGKRESDILTYKYFDISITFWGSNIGNNYSFCTTERLKENHNTNFEIFVLNILEKLIEKYNNCDIEIHFYNNTLAYKIIRDNPLLKKYILNINKQKIIDIVRHKTLSRVWLQNIVNVPNFTYVAKKDCKYNILLDKFPDFKQFVIQKSISGGGDGTYLLNCDNCSEIFRTLENNEVYLVSPYYENNRSLSCHLLIDKRQVIVFPASEQLLNYDNNKISYCGNRYLDISNKLSNQIKEMAIKVGYELMSIGYRGVCGLDFILVNNRLMLVEINPRYQGSSYIINAELKNLKLPSLFCLNTMSFRGYIDKEIVNKITGMSISYESHICTYKNGWTNSAISCPKNATLFLDGILNANKFTDNVYLYRYLVKVL